MRILLAFMALPIALSGMIASAQEPSREDVIDSMEECRAISVEFMRSACLEAANRFLQNSSEIAEVTPGVPAPVPPAPLPPVATTPLENESAEIDAARVALAKERAEIEEARAALAAQNQTQTENERLGLLARLGLARNAEKIDEKIAATITIDRVTYNRQKIHTFYTSDGDIIRQDRNTLRMRLPDSFPATATLERRTLGSKWLTFTDNPRRSYKVKILDSAR